MPAWLIPGLMATGQAVQSYLGNKAQQQQRDDSRDAWEVQMQRLADERQQRQRTNALDDQQSGAVNPMRQQLFTALAQRLGLPPGALSFGVSSPAVAQQRSVQLPAQRVAQTTAAGNAPRLEQQIAELVAQQQRSPVPQTFQPVIDGFRRQLAAMQQVAGR